MRRCGSPHPSEPWVCTLPEASRHLDHEDDEGHRWPDEAAQAEYERATTPGRQIVRRVAASATPPSSAIGAPQVRQPLVRPSAGTMEARLLGYLEDRSDRWVPAGDLVTSVGGRSEAVEALRLMVAAGWPIGRRQRRGRPEVWEYRLRA